MNVRFLFFVSLLLPILYTQAQGLPIVVPHLSDRRVKAGDLNRASVSSYTIMAVHNEDTSTYIMHCDESIPDTAIDNGILRINNKKDTANSYMVSYINYKGHVITEDNRGNKIQLLKGETKGDVPASYEYGYNEQGLLSHATETNKSNTQNASYLYNEEGQLSLIRHSRLPMGEDSLGLLLKYDRKGRVSTISHYSRIISQQNKVLPTDTVSKKGVRDIFSKAIGKSIVIDSIDYKYNIRGFIKEIVFYINNFKKVETKKYYYNIHGLVRKLDEDYRVFYFTYTYRK